MAARRARTYKLFRTVHKTKTRALHVTTALVMIASSLAGALPLLLPSTASALPSNLTELRLSATPNTVEAGGTTSFSVKEVLNLLGGWTNAIALKSPTTITASATNGQIALTCSGTWGSTATTTVALGQVVQGTFCYRSSTVGTQNVNVTANLTLPALLGGGSIADSLTVPFTVQDTTAPSVPVNGQPSGGIFKNTNVFNYTWDPSTDNSDGQIAYEYQASNVSGFNPSTGALTSVIWNSTANGSPAQKLALASGPSIPSVGTSDGTWYWQVRAIDASGNASNWSQVWGYTLDSQAPTTPTLLTPPNNGFETTNDFYFTWTASSDASPIAYEFKESPTSDHTDNNGSLTDNAWDSIQNGNSEQNNLTSPKIHSIGAPDGAYYWQVRAIDAAGNTSAWTSPWKVTIDTNTPAAPTATFTADNTSTTVPNGGATNSPSFTFHLSSGGDTTRYQLKYWNNIAGSAFNGEANAWNPTDLNGYSPALDTYKDSFTQGDGTHFFAFSACDAAGNCSAYSAPFVVTYDHTAPTGLANLSPNDSTVTTTAGLAQIDWTDASDPDGPVTYYYESSNSSATNSDGSFTNPIYQSGALTNSQIPTTGTPAGVYYWHVRAVDSLGNSTGWTNAWKVTVDNTAPKVTITAPSDGDTIRGTVTVSGTVTDTNPDHYYFVVKDSHGTVVAGPGTVHQATVSDWNWDTTNVADGTYTVDLEARDAAGNKDAGSVATVQVTVDNTAPVVAINGYGQSGNVIQPNVTATDNSPLTYLWTPTNPNVAISNAHALNPTFTVAADDTYSFTLTVTDAAGNSTSAPFSFTYTTPPAPQTTPPTPAFTGTTTTTGGSNATTPIADNGTGATQPQVLGDSATNHSAVKGDSTVNLQNTSTKKHGNFLVLGWWWLVALAVLAGLWFLFTRRSSDNKN